MSGEPHPGRRQNPPGYQADLLVAAGRERTVLLSGFLSGLCVFFAPLAVVGVGLLAAYVASVAGDGSSPLLRSGRPLERSDFQAVFAPAVDEAALLLSAGLVGAMLAQFRRWLILRQDDVLLRQGRRPFFREFAFLYTILLGLLVGLVATRGGWHQVERLLHATPAVILLMICATWMAHAVWGYCFRNIIELLASAAEREAAALRGRGRRLGPRGSHI